MKYRPEIDGLRAIALIPVIFFHAGFEQFSGGFIGVDVFFVISGYLITTIILSEKEKGTFSLVNFYERRARRILPALYLVMLISLPFAWFWLFPSDMKDFSQSLVAVSVFASNILFWQETGYWGVDNELKPLLHTWSLAVEEQYYVLFPIFLMVMWRFRKRWILGSFMLFAAASLLVSQWAAYNHPTANFFLLPTRAWELAIGASIAFYFVYRKQTIHVLLSHTFVDEIMSFLGLFMIAYSVIAFNKATPFPGFYALVPTVGAGLIILFSSKDTSIGKLLGSKVPVGIGLISYSAYLWHQPLFAFARHRSLTDPGKSLIIVLIFLTFLFAFLSWKYIEKPFRVKGLISKKEIFIFGTTGSIFFIIIGVAGHITNGFEFKNELSPDFIQEKIKPNYGLNKTCEGTFTLSSDCRTSNKPEILIWGDSYAMQLVHGVISSNSKAKIIQMTKSVCGPFFNIAPVSSKYPVRWAKECLEFTGQVHKWIKENHTLKYVVVSSHFNNYLSKNHKLLYRSGKLENAGIDVATQEFNKTLNELVAMNVIPIVFSSAPANGVDLGRCLAKAEWLRVSLDKCDFDSNQITQDRKNEYSFLNNFTNNYRIIHLDDLLCDDSQCKTHIGSTGLYRDKGHLSYAGSSALGERYGFYNIIVEDN